MVIFNLSYSTTSFSAYNDAGTEYSSQGSDTWIQDRAGDGLKMALEIGAVKHGLYDGCHATAMDLHMKDFGGLDLEPSERKNYRNPHFNGTHIRIRK